jgi:hypothetical protein
MSNQPRISRSRRSEKRLAKQAQRYVEREFQEIPADEARWLSNKNAVRIQELMDENDRLKTYLGVLALVPARPRGSVISESYGTGIPALRDEFYASAKRQKSQKHLTGGKKRFRKSHKNKKNKREEKK